MIGVCIKCTQRNYGSKLQALATLTAFSKLNLDYEILIYKKRGLWFKVKSLPRFFNIVFLNDRYDFLQKKYSFRKHPDVQDKILRRNRLFDEFDERYFKRFFVSIDYYNELKDKAKKYTTVITCSDQLWSPAALSTNFFNLMFVPDEVNKVSFASSFGVSKIPWYQKGRTKKFLRRIEHISVRENAGKEIIKNLIGRDVPVLMDPVFIFSKIEWQELIAYERIDFPPFVLCYFLGNNLEYRKAVKKFAVDNNFKIVTLPHLDRYVPEDEIIADYPLFDVSPAMFLNLIRNAKCVCTDSFHGCAFSIIMEKEFFVFNRYSDTSTNSKNSRISTICDNLDLHRRRVTEFSELSTLYKDSIDYVTVKRKLEVFADRAKNYLKQSII